MDPMLAAYAADTAPRYTSFPPIARFAPSVGPEHHAGWLAALDEAAPLSLYIHVPYCREICWYCGCETFAARRSTPLDSYVETVLAEIDLVASSAASQAVVGLVWGGGTPNLLSPASFERVVDRLELRFGLSGLERHAMEIDPRYLSAEHARVYAARGVRSASLGIQDLNPHVQRAIGRVQSFAESAIAVNRLRAAGVGTLGIDLMYGLPYQSTADALISLDQALTLYPDRVAIFGYDHGPEQRPRQRRIDALTLAAPPLRLEQALTLRDRLCGAGYERVGIDHFALPGDALAIAAREGRLRRNLHGYGADDGAAVLGFGPSAVSEFRDGYAQNAATVSPWRRAVASGRLATTRGHVFDQDDRRRRMIIQDLLCRFSTDLAHLGGALGTESAALERLARHGLVNTVNGRLEIPAAARPLARIVAKAFDPQPAAAPFLAI